MRSVCGLVWIQPTRRTASREHASGPKAGALSTKKRRCKAVLDREARQITREEGIWKEEGVVVHQSNQRGFTGTDCRRRLGEGRNLRSKLSLLARVR